MSYLISALKADVSRKLHGTSLNKVEGVYDLIYEAGRQLLSDIDPKSTIRIKEISSPVLSYSVYRFTAPEDLKGDKIIDIRPNSTRLSDDNWSKRQMEYFARKRSAGTFNVEYDSGSKTVCLPEVTVDTLGSTLNLVYYSSYLYRTSGDVWKEKPDDDEDIINLEVDSYNLLLNKTVELAASQIAGKDSSFDYTIYGQKYENGLKRYSADNPSENIKQQMQYYKV